MISIRDFVERDETIVNLCRQKSVLHLGCVGFTDCSTDEKLQQARKSLHALLTKSSSTCTGIDLDGATIKQLRDEDLFSNIIEGNVEHLENAPLGQDTFEIVVAGDIIEHLSNPGLMLDGIHERLRPDGKLLISTPNSFGIASWIRIVRGTFKEGDQHVICFNPITLKQLLERHGYQVDYAATCYQSRARGNFGKWFRILRTILAHMPRHGGTLLYICSSTKPRGNRT